MVDERERRPSILVVDDEEGMRKGCQRVLAPTGFSVDAAADISTALRLLQDRDYDLYLLDMMLPDGSGFDLLSKITQRDPDAICIIVTGFGSIRLAVEAIRHGAYDFLSKPFTSDELLLKVDQGLEWGRLKAIDAEADKLARTRAELERLGEASRQLMLGVAHELRAPVAAVQSYVNLLLAGYIGADEIRPTLFRIQERLHEVLDLSSDLLALARLKRERAQPPKATELQDVAAILRNVCDLFSEQLHEKEQKLQVEILHNPLMIADPYHLEQIWTNLLSNAIKYTPRGGQIEVTLQSDDDSIIGSVADSGIGIAAEDQPHLFEDFFRTDAAKESGEIGTGLGLAIVKQVIESYGGEILVKSRLGHGSRFTFNLPAQPGPEEPEPSSSEQQSSLPANQAHVETELPSVT